MLTPKRLIPVAIVGLFVLAGAGAVVGNWVEGIWDSSVRVEGQYADKLKTPVARTYLPKDSYICDPKQQKPWLGCSIR
ncbi:MAG: hypothetical protein P4M08_01990 [Oligoflexia bacterium]|nr:hypothetical protein [Oligoflexia bacterium]